MLGQKSEAEMIQYATRAIKKTEEIRICWRIVKKRGF